MCRLNALRLALSSQLYGPVIAWLFGSLTPIQESRSTLKCHFHEILVYLLNQEPLRYTIISMLSSFSDAM